MSKRPTPLRRVDRAFNSSVAPSTGTLPEGDRRRVVVRSLLIDVGLAPLLGFVVGAESGSLRYGLLAAFAWILVAEPVMFLWLRRHYETAAAGSPERFRPPRWLRRQGASWAMRVAFLQKAGEVEDSISPPTWWAEGYLFPTAHSFQFVPDRLARTRASQLMNGRARPWGVSFDEIASIGAARASGLQFASNQLSIRLVLKDGTDEWIFTFDVGIYEAAALLTHFLPPRDDPVAP